MNLMNLADLLEQKTIGKKAETIFLNMMPAECKLGILLRSPLTGTRIDHELPGYYKTKFQVIVRTPDYVKGEELIKKTVEALTIKNDTQVGGMLVRYMRPCHKPVPYPLSGGGFIEFNVSMETVFNEDD